MKLLMLILLASVLSGCVVRPLYPYRHDDYYGHDRYSRGDDWRGGDWRDGDRRGGWRR